MTGVWNRDGFPGQEGPFPLSFGHRSEKTVRRTIRFILHRLRPIHPPCLMAVAILYAVIIGLVLWRHAGTEGNTPGDPASPAVPVPNPDHH